MNKKKVALGVLGVSILAIIGLALGGWMTYKYLTVGFNQKVKGRGDNKEVSSVSLKEGPKITKPFNLLVLGVDNDEQRDWQGRSDTIVLMKFLPEEKQVHALSIPRDTLTTIPGRGQDKINHSYAFGGTDLAIQTVEGFTKQKVDYYMELDMDGFVKIVDEMGGVDFDLDRDISRGDMGIKLKAGKQHLDGRQALAVVRFRYEPMGDIARVKRQMRFLKAVIDQSITKKKSLDKVVAIRKIEENLQTDLGVDDLLGLLNTFSDTQSKNVMAEVVPGTFYNYKRVSYWKPDSKKLELTLNKLFE